MSPSFELKALDFFTAGAVGPPGERVFYLQAREAGALVTLKLEKEQVGALGAYLASALAKLRAADPQPGDPSLLEPIVPAWAVRSLGVGYDEARDRFVIVAEELLDEEEGEGAGREPASARFHVTRAQARAFVERARALLAAGRPACPVCGRPVNPGGHVCPRGNGHGRD